MWHACKQGTRLFTIQQRGVDEELFFCMYAEGEHDQHWVARCSIRISDILYGPVEVRAQDELYCEPGGPGLHPAGMSGHVLEVGRSWSFRAFFVEIQLAPKLSCRMRLYAFSALP